MGNVYSGTLGTFVDTDKIEYMINEHIFTVDSDLNYEFVEDRCKLVIITGKNDSEKALPSWSHPLVFKSTVNENIVAIDLRPYMKANLKDIITIRDNVNDKYNATILLYRMVFTKLIEDKETHWMSSVVPSLMEAFSNIIATTISIILYDNVNTDAIKIVSKIHFLSLINGDDDLENLIKKLPREDIQNLLNGDLSHIYNRLNNTKDLIIPSTTIGSLVTNIKLITDSDRTNGLNVDVLSQSLTRGFYSIDSKELAFAILEDLPSLIAVLTMVISEGINSKSTFRKIMNNNKRKIHPKELSYIFMDIYKKEIIEI